jgi:hypothetical protein
VFGDAVPCLMLNSSGVLKQHTLSVLKIWESKKGPSTVNMVILLYLPV